MKNKLKFEVHKNPCASCPYRKDTPAGLWHKEEYEKLRTYDDEMNPNPAPFLCHQTRVCDKEIICKGWLMVHVRSIAVRLLEMLGRLPKRAFSKPGVELYSSGNEAADAGEKGLRRPGKKAVAMAGKLWKTGAFRQ